MRLICPECRRAMELKTSPEGGGETWRCAACDVTFPVVEGAVKCLAENDAFYEGKFPGRWVLWPPKSAAGRLLQRMRLRWGIDLQYAELLRRRLTTKHRRILDLGCGGGNTELLRLGAQVVGVDLSWESVRNAAWAYGTALQASATRLPLPDASFDAIVSSNFLGHVPFEDKDALYEEMRRLLKPGGLMLHELETDSLGAFFRYGRRDPEFFQRQYVDLDGHVGQELPTASLERFHRHGFVIEEAHVDFVWWFVPQGEALKRLAPPGAPFHPVVRALVRLDRATEGRERMRKILNLGLGIANGLARRWTPLDRGIGLCVAVRKPN